MHFTTNATTTKLFLILSGILLAGSTTWAQIRETKMYELRGQVRSDTTMYYDADFVNGSFVKKGKSRDIFCHVYNYDRDGHLVNQLAFDSNMMKNYRIEKGDSNMYHKKWLTNYSYRITDDFDSNKVNYYTVVYLTKDYFLDSSVTVRGDPAHPTRFTKYIRDKSGLVKRKRGISDGLTAITNYTYMEIDSHGNATKIGIKSSFGIRVNYSITEKKIDYYD